jgi:hypothetical protein
MADPCPICLTKDERIAELQQVVSDVAIHTFHMLWLLGQDDPEYKKYFDAGPRGLKQHVGEIQKHCAEAGCKIAQTAKLEDADKWTK